MNWPSPLPGRAPVAEVLAVAVEDGDAVEPLVSNVKVAFAVQRAGGGPIKVARGLAELAELAYEILVHGDDGNAHTVGAVFVGAVDHVDLAFVVDSQVHGVAQAGSVELVAPDGMAIRESSVHETE